MPTNSPHPLITSGRINQSLTYDQYHTLMQEQAAASAEGLNAEAAEKLEFTKLNLHRSERIGRTYKAPAQIKELIATITTPQTWLVLTEPWCGDSAQCLPYMAELARLNSNISLRMILRDDNPDIMDQFLTDGKRSIPRLVIFDVNGCQITDWGPRPADAQVVFNDAKEAGLEKKDVLEKLHLFYGRNRGAALEEEFRYLLSGLVK